jgi:hypothetical protein
VAGEYPVGWWELPRRRMKLSGQAMLLPIG